MPHVCLFLACMLAALGASAQTLSLKQAVELAIEQSLAVRTGELSLRRSELDLRQNKLARYPSVNFRSTAGVQFGLNVDPTTNDLVQQRTTFASPSLDANLPLYQGGLIKRSIAQGKTQVAAAEADLDDIKQDVALGVAEAYLSSLLAQEQVETAENLLASARAELSRTERLIAAGTLAPVNQFEAESSVARQEQARTRALNDLALAKLRLKQLLRKPVDEVLELVDPATIDFDAITLPAVDGVELYAAALPRQPAIRAAELSEEAAAQGIAVAKSGYLPTLTAFGQLDTRYSSQAKQATSFVPGDLNEQTVFINSMPVTFGVETQVPVLENIPVTEQLRDFFGQAVGLSLNVPIFNNGRTKSAVEIAELALVQAQLATESERQDLEVEVQQAIQNAINARAEVTASKRALAAAQTAYEAALRRSELGAGSSYDLTNTQILLERAQTSLLLARYQYVFNAKVVDFYLGRPLDLN